MYVCYIFLIFLAFPAVYTLLDNDVVMELKMLRHIIEQQNEVIEDIRSELDKQREVSRHQDVKIDLLVKALGERDEEAREMKDQIDKQRQKQEVSENEVKAMRKKTEHQQRAMNLLRQRISTESCKHGKKDTSTGTAFYNQRANSTKDLRHEGKIIRKGRDLQSPNDGSVAFYAYMLNEMTRVGGHHTLIFDVVKLNVANAYHPVSGIFMAPFGGLYVFTWSVRVNGGSYHSVELARNGNEVGAVNAWVDNYGSSTSSTTVVIQVEKGDALLLRTKMDRNNGTIGSNSYGYTSFAGWKLN